MALACTPVRSTVRGARALYVDGTATQTASFGGIIKAAVEVVGNFPSPSSTNCFNGVSGTSSPNTNCGINIARIANGWVRVTPAIRCDQPPLFCRGRVQFRWQFRFGWLQDRGQLPAVFGDTGGCLYVLNNGTNDTTDATFTLMVF